eukprot:Rmarinus@m.5190
MQSNTFFGTCPLRKAERTSALYKNRKFLANRYTPVDCDMLQSLVRELEKRPAARELDCEVPTRATHSGAARIVRNRSEKFLNRRIPVLKRCDIESLARELESVKRPTVEEPSVIQDAGPSPLDDANGYTEDSLFQEPPVNFVSNAETFVHRPVARRVEFYDTFDRRSPVPCHPHPGSQFVPAGSCDRVLTFSPSLRSAFSSPKSSCISSTENSRSGQQRFDSFLRTACKSAATRAGGLLAKLRSVTSISFRSTL